MLKMPGRGKKSVNRESFFSQYKSIFSTVKTSRDTRKEIKKTVSQPIVAFGKKAQGAIHLDHVDKSFGNNLILKNLNLEIPNGKIFGIIGVSGSGKTTLLRLIAGYYKPSKGVITFNKLDVQKHPNAIAKHLGFATQDNCFYGDLTSEENIRFFGKLYGLSDASLNSRVDNALRVVELFEHKSTLAKNLSGGMQRRLDLACAIVNDPSVLILDEPTEDLDPILRKELLGLIKKINRMGTTIIFTTHLLNEAEYLCDKVAILSDNTVVTIGTPDDLRKAYRGGEEIHLVLEDTSKYGVYLKRLGKYKTKTVNGRMIVYVPVRTEAVRVLKNILTMVERKRDKIVYADIRKPTLGEVFTKVIKHAKPKKSKKTRK